jgi:hypothetical protein
MERRLSLVGCSCELRSGSGGFDTTARQGLFLWMYRQINIWSWLWWLRLMGAMCSSIYEIVHVQQQPIMIQQTQTFYWTEKAHSNIKRDASNSSPTVEELP